MPVVATRIAASPPQTAISATIDATTPGKDLTRIFNHGFTTRKDGHGFGLHSGALAAKELGGSLQVQSDGPDQGAVFTLDLPIGRPQKCHEIQNH
jgi:two-component system NtrC family sensor kinase